MQPTLQRTTGIHSSCPPYLHTLLRLLRFLLALQTRSLFTIRSTHRHHDFDFHRHHKLCANTGTHTRWRSRTWCSADPCHEVLSDLESESELDDLYEARRCQNFQVGYTQTVHT